MGAADQGRSVLVTGGASGIGRATAVLLARLGFAVTVADRNDAVARDVAESIKEEGGRAHACRIEVTDGDSVRQGTQSALNAFGRLDGLVHSAGVGVERSFLETTEEEWRRLVDIDLTGTFLCAQAAARHMASVGYGRIVLISSTAGLRGGTGRAAYGAAKGGVIALGRVMAAELGGVGVTTNIVAPGAIETELVARMHDAETRRAYLSGIPAGRYGRPEEVASVIAFLISEDSSYVNGTVVGIDGGFLSAGVLKGRRE